MGENRLTGAGNPVRRLSKTRLLSHLQCPRRLWLETFRPELAATSAATVAAFSAGNSVGAVARRIYGGSDGVLIDTGTDTAAALAATTEILEGGACGPLFEAAFEYGGVLIRADVLVPLRGSYRLVEVKASTALKDEHAIDCAIQNWVMSGAGLAPRSVSLAHVDNRFEYRGNDDYNGLLVECDVGDSVAALDHQVPRWIRDALATLDGGEPEVAVGAQCDKPHACPFKQSCWSAGARYPVTGLGGSKAKIAALVNDGYRDIRDVPAERLAGAAQQRIRAATCRGAAQLEEAAVTFARGLAYPRFFLDFETISPAVPVWPGTRPYETLPVQYSCHIEQAPGEFTHEEFLELSLHPPLRALAEALIRTLRQTGPILTYSSYERRVIGILQNRFPDLAEALAAIAARLQDLLPVTRNHYYHPDMLGSWSIKSVLPAIAPDLDYAELEGIRDGAAAADAYLCAISAETANEERARLEQQLRDYCRFDTLAMVSLLRFFESGGRPAGE
jgi:hypothetical protein